MGSSYDEPDINLPLLESSVVPTIFFDGIARIEPHKSGNITIVLFEQRANCEGAFAREIVTRIVCAKDGVPMLIQALLTAMGKVVEPSNVMPAPGRVM